MKTLCLPCLPALLLLFVFTLTGTARAQIGPGALADAIDQSSLNVTATGGWTRVIGATAHDGVDAAQLTLVSGSHYMDVAVTGPARVSWWWRKSLSGGTLRAEGIYGAVLAATDTWIREQWVLPAGANTLRFWGTNYSGSPATFLVDELEVTPVGTRGLAAWSGTTPRAVPYEPTAVMVAGKGPSYDPEYLVLRSDGTVRAYGTYIPAPPAGLNGAVSIAMSESGGALALHGDGTVTGWGTTVPEGITDAVQVAAGHSHFMILRSNGAVVVWGSIARMVEGQFGGGFSNQFTQATTPAGLPKLTHLAAGGSWSMGLTVDGRIAGWNDGPSFLLPYRASASPFYTIAATGELDVIYRSGEQYQMAAVMGIGYDGAGTNGLTDLIHIGSAGVYGAPRLGVKRDGTLVSFSGQPVPGSAGPVAAVDSRELVLAIVGDTALPPEFISARAAVVLGTTPEQAATRVWYQCNVVNGAQSYSSGPLPPGLSLDAATGRVFGQPTASGLWDVLFTATNAVGQGERSVRLHVDATPMPVVDSTARTANQDFLFTHSITPAGSPPALSYAVSGLPFWLTLNAATGVLSGTPTYTGTFSMTLEATNSTGITSASFSITVVRVAPTLPNATRVLRPGQWLHYALAATGGPHSAQTATPLPPGLSFSNGVISGRPTQAGEYDIALSATNAGGTGTGTLHISVVTTPAPQMVVTTNADELDTPAGAAVSLREALRDVPYGGTVTFAPSVLGQTIALSREALVVADKDVIIRAEAPGITLTGSGSARILEIGIPAWVQLANLTLAGGRAPAGTATVAAGGGGAVRCEGGFSAENCVFCDNRAGTGFTSPVFGGQGQSGANGGPGGSGGAIWSTGAVTLRGCRFTGNAAGAGGIGAGAGEPQGGSQPWPGSGGNGGSGGAIQAPSVILIGCELTSNFAGRGGNGAGPRLQQDPTGTGGNGGSGGAVISSSATFTGCYLAENIAGGGGSSGGRTGSYPGPDGGNGSGGALIASSANLTNCTFRDNHTGFVGGFATTMSIGSGGAFVASGGSAVHCTITANSSMASAWAFTGTIYAPGGGISAGAGFTVENCIVAANASGDVARSDLADGIILAGANLIGIYGTTAGPLNGTVAAPLSPGLLPASWNGGATRSMVLSPASPALNAAISSAATPGTDQRGAPRTAGAAPDLGSVEMGPLPGEAFAPGLALTPSSTGYALRWQAIAGSYSVEQSTTLTAGSWGPVPGISLPSPVPGTTVEAAIPFTSELRRYFRVRWQP